MDWPRVAAMTADSAQAKAPGSLAALLAADLFGAAAALTHTKRTQSVAAEIRDEILSQGCSTDEGYATLLGLEESVRARIRHLGIAAVRFPVGEIFGPVRESDRGFLHLPRRLEFLHHVVRPVRLVVQHGRKVGWKVWSMVR